ncbi:MAG: thiolase family protein [Chloroflexi bacterium]|nr:thiolase family protein [Chloroflexota bacterium]
MPASNSLKDSVAIVGIGHTEFARSLGRHPMDLIGEAMQNAIDDCGLRKEDIDGLCTNVGAPGSADVDAVAYTLGLELNWYGQTWNHGRFNGSVVQWASFIVHHGIADYVACIFGTGQGPRMVGGGGAEEAREAGGGHGESPPYGMTSPGAGAALAAQNYFHRYGVSSEQLAAIPIAFRKHASMNPYAIRRDPLTLDDYLNARFVCEPLRLFDYCQVNDGGTCVIITTAERARALKKPPVYIMGMQGIRGGRQEFIFGLPGQGMLQQDEFTYAPKPEELRVYQMAGVKPEDIDALYTYDAFSYLPWVALERFAFCGPGEAAAFTQNGGVEVGGRLPMNTSGGLLSEAHLNGWGNHMEIVRQLRGEAGERQVKDIEIAMYGAAYGDAIIYRR